MVYFHERSQFWNVFVIQEQRVQISPTRYRVPDICVMLGPEPNEQIFTKPPFLCVEVLSPDDRMQRMQVKINDYLGFGVRFVWIVDPWKRKAWIHSSAGVEEVQDGLLRTKDPELIVPLVEVFGK